MTSERPGEDANDEPPNPDTAPPPQPAGGLSRIPIAIATGVVAVVIAACSSLGASPGATPGATGTAAPPLIAATPAPDATAGGPVEPAEDGTATLILSGAGGDIDGEWLLDGNSADVSPTDTLIAGVWAKGESNLEAGYADLRNLTIGGTIVEGTQTTSSAGIIVSFTLTRTDATGTDLFFHQFTSSAGECQVTMARAATGITGSFECPSLTSASGVTVTARGTFAT